jgi:hypothetical protein
MSVQTDPNYLPLYNFNNCFSVGVLTIGSVGPLCGEGQPLLIWWDMPPVDHVSLYNVTSCGFCIALSFRKMRLLKLCTQYFVGISLL